MAATDNEIVSGWFNPYLAKKKKTKSKTKTMSQDRRIITDNEILGLFEFYLRRWCSINRKNTVVITNKSGKKLFEATLIDKEEEEDEPNE